MILHVCRLSRQPVDTVRNRESSVKEKPDSTSRNPLTDEGEMVVAAVPTGEQPSEGVSLFEFTNESSV